LRAYHGTVSKSGSGLTLLRKLVRPEDLMKLPGIDPEKIEAKKDVLD